MNYLHEYQAIKEKYQDAIILIENNDFYNAINSDADKVSELLNLQKSNRVDLNGVNYVIASFNKNNLDEYLTKLVKLGNKVGLVKLKIDDNLHLIAN